jgi:hypothetical protein
MLFLIGGIFSFFGKLFISSCTGLIGYLLITRLEQFNDKLNSPVLPTFVYIYNVGHVTSRMDSWCYYNEYLRYIR